MSAIKTQILVQVVTAAMTTFQQKKNERASLFTFYHLQPMKGTSFQQVISNTQLQYLAAAVKQ